MNKIIIVGGGTAGHIYPGISMANFFIQKNKKSDILFITSQSGIEEKLLNKEKFNFKTFKSYGINRKMTFKNIFLNIKSLFYLMKNFLNIYLLINKFKPNFIFSTGSYVSFSVLLIAKINQIPFYLLESNAYPGLITKFFAKYAKKIFINFDICKEKLYNKNNIINTGIPLRLEYNSSLKSNKILLNNFKLPVVLSFFGSLGSSSMNQVIENYLKLVSNYGKIIHIHITGNTNNNFYQNIIYKKNVIIKKYIHNIYDYINISSLVICRAGANTLSEISFFNKPTIIIPSPYVSENHQFINAIEHSKKNSALVLNENELNSNCLYKLVLDIINNNSKIFHFDKNINIIHNANEKIYKIILKDQGYFNNAI